MNRHDAKEEEETGFRIELGSVLEETRSRIEPGSVLDGLAHRVIGAAIEVHRHLGPGFLESVYEDAMAIEFDIRGIDYERQKVIAVEYKGASIGEGRLDFLVGGCLIVELKAIAELAPIHKAQVISYLRATGMTLGLLINFNVPVLKTGLQRIILS